jgi:hypothetical protein
MMKALAAGAAALASAALMGCDPGTVSQDDMEAVREEMSKERYEQAMRDAGRGAELEAQQKADAERMAADGGQ